MRPVRRPGRPRPRGSVVYLHGVGTLRSRWQPAVTRALAFAPAHLVGPDYSRLLASGPRVHARPRMAVDRSATPAQREEFVARQSYLADLIARVGESADITWPSAVPHPSGIADRLPMGPVLRTPVFGLDQVGRYLDDAARRAAVLQRVVTALLRAPRPRIVVAHSLGSLVAWDAMADPRVNIDLLVTLGSPLAHPAIAPRRRDIPYGRVGGWLNVVHLLDPVPAARGLADAFPEVCDAFLFPAVAKTSGANPFTRIASTVASAATSHLESTYLESRTVAAAMRQALLAPTLSTAAGVAS